MGSADRLFDLLPAWYRRRDTTHARDGQPGPLQGFLRVIAEQVEAVEADITTLYDNWFIDTCEDWVVPYIADLVGYEMVPEAGHPADDGSERASIKNRFLVPRREVAHLIRYRRRKGSLAVLEQLARDVAGWRARAVEFGTLVGTFQSSAEVRPNRGRSVSVRDSRALEAMGTPFDRTARSVDVRTPTGRDTAGRWNLPNVGLFVTTSNVCSVTDGDAHSVDPDGTFTFSALGNDTALWIAPVPEEDPTALADPLNLPLPLTRLALEAAGGGHADEAYYGQGKSVAIYADGRLVPASRIVSTNLAGWAYRPKGQTVALDPELGRLAFPADAVPSSVRVTYRYAFPAAIGGGEYPRPATSAAAKAHVETIVAHGESHNLIQAAVRRWHATGLPHGVIELADSHVYSETKLRLVLAPGQTLELRARSGTRPIVRVVDYKGTARDAIILQGPAPQPTPQDGAGPPGPRFVLDGVMVMGGGLDVRGDVAAITIRHSTLVPGWDLQVDSVRARTTEPSLRLSESAPRVTILNSVVGPLRIEPLRDRSEPIRLSIADSILDALGDDRDAIADPDAPFAHVDLKVQRSTIAGRVNVHALRLAENSIFTGELHVARRQSGCVRFCSLTPGSTTPQRFNCLDSVRPVFASRRYGGRYYRLALTCPSEIRRGADDESEMGVYHDLYLPQREAVLRARLREYVPVGFVPALIFLDNE